MTTEPPVDHGRPTRDIWTNRIIKGRRQADFRDARGVQCSVAEDTDPAYLWLGVDGDRMKLTRQQVREFFPLFTYWLENDELMPMLDGSDRR